MSISDKPRNPKPTAIVDSLSVLLGSYSTITNLFTEPVLFMDEIQNGG